MEDRFNNVWAIVITHEDNSIPSGTTIKLADSYAAAQIYLRDSFQHSFNVINSDRFSNMRIEKAEFNSDEDMAYMKVISGEENDILVLETIWRIHETFPASTDEFCFN